MRVLLASAEAEPFAKVGGLADVAGSLPAALRQAGVDARVILPGYGFIDHRQFGIEPLFSFDFPHRLGVNTVRLFACEHAGIPFYLLQSPPYFGMEGDVYSHWNWDMERYIYFNQALMAAFSELDERVGWFPDCVHVNDWHTSLLPFMIQRARWRGPMVVIGKCHQHPQYRISRQSRRWVFVACGSARASPSGFDCTWLERQLARNRDRLQRYGVDCKSALCGGNQVSLRRL